MTDCRAQKERPTDARSHISQICHLLYARARSLGALRRRVARLGHRIRPICEAPNRHCSLARLYRGIDRAPRRYGFHATLKPPFRLGPGQMPETLSAELAAFCAQRPTARLKDVQIDRMGRFLAITATDDTSAADDLAAATVRHFDSFRAPPTEAEITRHQRPSMSTAQAENLRLWGHPHVTDQFRWHMTLTGRHPAPEMAHIQAALAPVLAPLLAPPPVINALSLVGEDEAGHFRLIYRAALCR